MKRRIIIRAALGLAMGLLFYGPLAGTAYAQWENPPVSVAEDAEQGDPLSQFVTGRKLLIDAANSGDETLEAEGVAFLERAAAQGFVPAIRQIGEHYQAREGGLSVRAARWLGMAAREGDPASQRMMGDAYRKGEGGDPDPVQAAHWYRELLDNPNASYESDRLWEVEILLAGLLADGSTGTVDAKGARALWEHAATVGHALNAQELLAAAYATGFGGEKNIKAAIQQYHTAAMDGISHGYRYGMSREETRMKLDKILSAMEELSPRHKLTIAVRKELEGL